jgi:hypothetical protein
MSLSASRANTAGSRTLVDKWVTFARQFTSQVDRASNAWLVDLASIVTSKVLFARDGDNIVRSPGGTRK